MISMLAIAWLVIGCESIEVDAFAQQETELSLPENPGPILFVSIATKSGNSSSSLSPRIDLTANLTIHAGGGSGSFLGSFELRSESSYIILAELDRSFATLKVAFSNPSSQNLEIIFQSLQEINVSEKIDTLVFLKQGSSATVRTGEVPRSLSLLSCTVARGFSIESDLPPNQIDDIFVQKTLGNSRLSLPKQSALKIVGQETTRVRLIASNFSRKSLFFANNGHVASNSNSFAFPEVQSEAGVNSTYLAAFGDDRDALKSVLDCNIPSEGITVFEARPSKRIELPRFEGPGYLGVSALGSEQGPFTYPLVQTFSIHEYDPQIRRSNLVFQVVVAVLGLALLAGCLGVGYKIRKLREMRADCLLERED